MAITVSKQTIINGPRNLVVKVHIDGPATTTANITSTNIVDVSALSAEEVKIMKVQSSLSGFTAELIWDATTDVHALSIPEDDFEGDYRQFGGLINNAGAGKTGDILLSSLGSLEPGTHGTITIEMRKRGTNP